LIFLGAVLRWRYTHLDGQLFDLNGHDDQVLMLKYWY
jgi:hypothetical protein